MEKKSTASKKPVVKSVAAPMVVGKKATSTSVNIQPKVTAPVVVEKKPFVGFKDAKIDSNGTFKYIQIHLQNMTDPSKKQVLIRGSQNLKYHKDILSAFVVGEFGPSGQGGEWEYHCPGGGRIKVTADTKTIFIYGYSKTFGRVDHSITQTLL